MTNRSTRRGFLKYAAVSAALPLIARCRTTVASRNSKLQHAAIGVGGRGSAVTTAIGGQDNVEVVAICDVDAHSLNEAAQAYPEARRYRDWRELLAQEGDRIDSVSVATPDHAHAPAAMTAVLAGKHVYCEKPLTHTVYEARQLAVAARKAGVATQMGIQIHAHAVYRQAVRLLRDGAIGKIKVWHSWSQARYSTPGMTRPLGEDPVPAHLDWDLWIGVAPMRPYKEGVYHPGRWRGWQDFGCGAMGDFGCHIFDPVFTALEIGGPLSVRGEAPEMNDEVWPHWGIVHYEFPGTKLTADSTIEATWYDGGKKPPRELALMPDGQALPDSGSLIIGEEGVMVLPHYKKAQLYPVERFRDYALPEVGYVNHFGEWVDACLGRGRALADFDYSGPLTEAVLLGNIAVRFPGKTLGWRAAKLRFRDAPEADAFVRRPYRPGWAVPGLTT